MNAEQYYIDRIVTLEARVRELEAALALLRPHAWRHPDLREAVNTLDADAALAPTQRSP